jgi:hypothetical protein
LDHDDFDPTWWRGGRRQAIADQEAATLWLIAEHLERLHHHVVVTTLDGSRPQALQMFRGLVRSARLSYAKAQERLAPDARVVYLCHAKLSVREALSSLTELVYRGLISEQRARVVEARGRELDRAFEFLVGRATQAALLSQLTDPPATSPTLGSRAHRTLRERLAEANATRRRLHIAPIPSQEPKPAKGKHAAKTPKSSDLGDLKE